MSPLTGDCLGVRYDSALLNKTNDCRVSDGRNKLLNVTILNQSSCRLVASMYLTVMYQVLRLFRNYKWNSLI
jgi:hypothetical protein